MNMNENNWQGLFTNFVLIGIILLLLFRVIRYSLPILIRSSKWREILKRQLPVMEIFFWFIFLSWFTFRFAQMKELYALVIAGLLFILLFWFSRFFLRELIAGIIFKTNHHYKKGDIITTQGFTGKIERFGPELLEIEASDGQIVFITYSKLVGDAIHIRTEGSEKSAGHTFSISTNWQGNTAEFEKEVQAFALNLPWISLTKPVQVSMEDTIENVTTFNITIYLINRDFAINAEKALMAHFSREDQ